MTDPHDEMLPPDRREHPVEDFEFSDYGRDPRFPSGWYILPAILFGIGFWIAVISFII